MKFDGAANSAKTRLVAMCLSPESGGGFEVREVPRSSPAADEIEVAVAAASVNPIDVRRAAGYGRRLLGASQFPMTLGNDFAGTVDAVGARAASAFAVGERVYGLKPASRDGSHASHLVVKAMHARKAPPNRNIQDLAALPYCFVTMWLAAKAAGLARDNAERKKVLVHGAAGGLGILALQTVGLGSEGDRHRQRRPTSPLASPPARPKRSTAIKILSRTLRAPSTQRSISPPGRTSRSCWLACARGRLATPRPSIP